jgi:nicotinate-nucleotide pyrophosphorylase [carboxylating] (EC 2.4.2.19)
MPARRQERASFTKKIEVEIENHGDMIKAAKAGADIIMFDNMTPEEISRGVQLLEQMGLRDRLLLEASGGITRDNISEYAASGVDVISLGALTRNARWIDLSMDIQAELEQNSN